MHRLAVVCLTLCAGILLACGNDGESGEGGEQITPRSEVTGCERVRRDMQMANLYQCDQGVFALDDDGNISREGPPTQDGPGAPQPKQEIAHRVNAMLDSLVEGDGFAGCSFMTAQGQHLQVRLAEDLYDVAADTCQEAVAAIASQGGEGTIRIHVRPTDVSVFQGKRRAQVVSKYPGAMELRLVRGHWLVTAPGFFN